MTIDNHEQGTELVELPASDWQPKDGGRERQPSRAQEAHDVKSLFERLRQGGRVPEVLTESRPGVVDWLREQLTPQPGETEVPGWRKAWVWGVGLPIRVIARLLEDAAETPGRFFPALLLGFLVGSLLNQVPVVGLLIPDQLDVTTWL